MTTTFVTEARVETLARIRALLVGILEETPEARVERLLERIASAPHPERARALLTELGAMALLREES